MSNRRQWLRGLSFAIGASINGGAVRAFAKPKATAAEQGSAPAERLALADYEPKSMLQVHETQIERARFPAIDIHTHITVSAKSENGVGLSPDRKYLGTPDELLAVMDRKPSCMLPILCPAEELFNPRSRIAHAARTRSIVLPPL